METEQSENRRAGETVKSKQMECIWGQWWVPWRPSLYTAWLAYELNWRCLKYCTHLHHKLEVVCASMGHVPFWTIDILSLTLVVAMFHGTLTLPVCFLFYKFLSEEDLTKTGFERRIKKLL